jgi:hypothetical protein
MTKKERKAAAKKGVATRKRNARKAEKASKKTSKAAQKARTSRGMRVAGLHFAPRLYGKKLTPALAALGIRGDRVPVIMSVGEPKVGRGSLEMFGYPSVVQKAARAHVDKTVRLETQLKKATKDLVDAAGSGKSQSELKPLTDRVVALSKAIVNAAAFGALVKGLKEGMSEKELLAALKKAGYAKAKEIGAESKIVAEAVAPVAAATKASGVASATGGYAAGGYTGGSMPDFAPGSVSASGIPVPAAVAPKPLTAAEKKAVKQANEVYAKHAAQQYGSYGATALKKNPDGWILDGDVRHAMHYEISDRTNPEAVAIVLSPTFMKYAIISPRTKTKTTLTPNGRHSMRKNMSKRSMRKNPLGGQMMLLAKPVLGASAGFVASRLVNAVALMAASKATPGSYLTKPVAQGLIRLGTTGAGVAATFMYGDKIPGLGDLETRNAFLIGMALNAVETSVRAFFGSEFDSLKAGANPFTRDLALGDGYGYDMSHAGAPYSPMMGEYVSQSLNGFGEYVSQSLNGDMGSYVAQAAAGMGEYVSQSLNGIGEYSEGVDPSDQEGVDGMIDAAEGYAGLGTSVMAATAGLGTSVMAATAGLYGFGDDAQGEGRGIVTRRGIYNYFTDPQMAGGGQLPSVSIEDAPMPVTNMGTALPGAVPIGENVATPEGRGYAGGIFGRHVFGTMI